MSEQSITVANYLRIRLEQLGIVGGGAMGMATAYYAMLQGANAQFQSSCMAALPKAGDKKMFLDFVPASNNNIVLFSAGWAFKFTPIIGLA